MSALLSRIGLVKTFLLSGGDKSSRNLTGELERVHARIQKTPKEHEQISSINQVMSCQWERMGVDGCEHRVCKMLGSPDKSKLCCRCPWK